MDGVPGVTQVGILPTYATGVFVLTRVTSSLRYHPAATSPTISPSGTSMAFIGTTRISNHTITMLYAGHSLYTHPRPYAGRSKVWLRPRRRRALSSRQKGTQPLCSLQIGITIFRIQSISSTFVRARFLVASIACWLMATEGFNVFPTTYSWRDLDLTSIRHLPRWPPKPPACPTPWTRASLWQAVSTALLRQTLFQ